MNNQRFALPYGSRIVRTVLLWVATTIIVFGAGFFLIKNTIRAFATASLEVDSFTSLVSAVADPSEIINISITEDFPLTGTVHIPAGKTVHISSGGATRHTLTRAFASRLFSMAEEGSTLTFTNIIIDGNELAADEQMVKITNGTLNIGKDTILRNSNNTREDCEGYSCGGAIGANGKSSVVNIYDNSVLEHNKTTICGGALYLTSGTMNIYDDAVIRNNESTVSHGGAICVGNSNSTLNINGDASIVDNRSTASGGGVHSFYGATLNISGNATIARNHSQTHGGGLYFSSTEDRTRGTLNIFENAQIVDNTAEGQSGGMTARYSDVNIRGNASISRNTAGTSYGGLALGEGSMGTIGGNVTIVGNRATEDVGGIGVAQKSIGLIIEGNVVIENNSTGGYGGGIYSSNTPTLTIKDDVKIRNNTAGTSGGGIRSWGAVEISDRVEISDNKAKDGGGIDLIGSTATLLLKDNVVLSNNTADSGGAIHSDGLSTAQDPLRIQGSVAIVNNTARTGDGGAISIPHAALSSISIDQNVVFSGNSAATYALNIDPADQDTYDSTIQTSRFTAPFQNAYNNYDIAYAETDMTEIIVFFDTGSDDTIAPQFVPIGGSVSEPDEPSKEGKVFGGWYTGPTFSYKWDFESDKVDSDLVPGQDTMIFAAKWDDKKEPVSPEEPEEKPTLPSVPNSGVDSNDAELQDNLAPIVAIIASVSVVFVVTLVNNIRKQHRKID